MNATARAVSRRDYDTTLRATVQSNIGYRARCRCGWAGKFRMSMSLARADAAAHNREHRAG